MNLRRVLLALAIVVPVLLGCRLLTGRGDGAPAAPQSDEGATQAPLIPFPNASSVEYPLKPDPVSVQITVDKSNSVDSMTIPGAAMGTYMILHAQDGSQYELNTPEMPLLPKDGTLHAAPGTKVTMMPITAVAGVPFEAKFLGGVEMSPEGLQASVETMTLTITLPGSYPADQIFAGVAEASGAEFHLVPATVMDIGDGQTHVYVNLRHFSGVFLIQATVEAAGKRKAHPPTAPLDQADDMLVSLVPKDKHELLQRMYDADVKDWPATLQGPCNIYGPVEAAKSFFNWYMEVSNAQMQGQFKNEIQSTSKSIQQAFDRCLGLTCSLCSSDSKYVTQMVLATYYVERLSAYSGLPMSDLYYPVTNLCLQKHGMTSPFIGVGHCGTDCPGAESAPTPVTACPATSP